MSYLEIFLFLLVIVFLIIYNASHSNISYYIYPSQEDPSFQEQVRSILQNTKFQRNIRVSESSSAEHADIAIHLTSRAEMDKWHKEPQYYPSGKQIRFSITSQRTDAKPQIYIDAINWLYGVEESGLTPEQYRAYVIRHEFMHALGYEHQPCNADTAVNGVCPVLYQSTRGCPQGFQCGYQITPADYGSKLPFAYFK
jgi:hypothetical protein